MNRLNRSTPSNARCKIWEVLFLLMFSLTFTINCKDQSQDKLYYESALSIAQKSEINISDLKNIETLLQKIDKNFWSGNFSAASTGPQQCNLYHAAALRDNIQLFNVVDSILKGKGKDVACPFTPLQIAAYAKANRVLQALAEYPIEMNKYISGWSCQDDFPSPHSLFVVDTGNTPNPFDIIPPPDAADNVRKSKCSAPYYFADISALILAARRGNATGLRILLKQLFEESEKEKAMICYNGIELGKEFFTFLPKAYKYKDSKWSYSVHEGLTVYANAKGRAVNVSSILCPTDNSACEK